MAAAGVALVVGIIPRQPHEQGAAVIFQRPAGGFYVLVVILRSGGEVSAESLAGEDGAAAADAEAALSQGKCETADDIGLVIAAVSGAECHSRHIAQPAGDVFDRSADGVAAVEGSLRTSKHLDPLDVVNVEHCALRTVQVDVVQIDADAVFETGHRVLLADSADECGEGGVGPSRRLQSHVGRRLGDVGNVYGPRLLELLARISGDRDRHVDEPFHTAAGGDHDLLVLGRAFPGFGLGIGFGNLGKGGSGNSDRRQRGADFERGDESVHGHGLSPVQCVGCDAWVSWTRGRLAAKWRMAVLNRSGCSMCGACPAPSKRTHFAFGSASARYAAVSDP